MKYAVVSTDCHPHYSFFAPLTAEMWRRIGYEPLVLLCGDFDPAMHVVADHLSRLGVRTERVHALSGYRTSTLAQVGRMYGFALAAPEDYVIVSDIDMWPLRADWFTRHEAPAGHLALLYANNRQRFPMCYVAGQATVWREICQVPEGAGSVQDLAHAHLLRHLSPTTHAADAWQHDEEWLTARIHAWANYPSRCLFVSRAAGEPPADRLDRGAWKSRAPVHIDAHLLRPGFAHWPHLRQALGSVPDWAEAYLTAYTAALGKERA